MDKQIVFTLEKFNCACKCCGTFVLKPADDVDGKIKANHKPCSKLRRLCCCFAKED